jgi:hypothetical protein
MMIVDVKREFWHAPEEVWRVIGRFDAFDWASGIGPLLIEAGRPPDQVGVVRAFRQSGAPTRQRLTAYCAATRSYSYEALTPYRGLAHYAATIAVSARADGGSTVSWTASVAEVVPDKARALRGFRATMSAELPDHGNDRAAVPTSDGYRIAVLSDEFRKSFDKLEAILDMALSA